MNESIRQRLRTVLRQGDPADEPGLTAEEVLRMRRTILAAGEEPARRRFLLPILATTAAAVVLTLTVALALWRSHSREIAPPERTVTVDKALPTLAPSVDRAPEASIEPPAPPAPVPPPEPVRPWVSERPRQRRSVPRTAEVQLASVPTAPPAAADSEEEPQPRQIQFSTPGGTRVLWTLTPEPIL